MCLGKHIYRLNFFYGKSSLDKQFNVSDHSHRITWNIQQLKIWFSFEIANHLNNIFMEAISRRIDDDKPKVVEFVFDFRCLGKCLFSGISQERYLVFQSVDFGVVSCIRDSFFYNFYPDKFFTFSHLQKSDTYASCSTIEIQHSSFYISHHIHCLIEKLLCSERIRLKKRKRRNPKRYLCWRSRIVLVIFIVDGKRILRGVFEDKFFKNVSFSSKCFGFTIRWFDDIGQAVIIGDDKCIHFLMQDRIVLDSFEKGFPLCCGVCCEIMVSNCKIDKHLISVGTFSDNDMSKKSLMRHLIIRGESRRFAEFLNMMK